MAGLHENLGMKRGRAGAGLPKLDRRKVLLVVAAGLVVLGLAMVAAVFVPRHVETRFTAQQAQTLVNALMPLRGSRNGLEYEVRSVTLEFRPGGRVGWEADVVLRARSRAAEVNVAGSARLSMHLNRVLLTTPDIAGIEARPQFESWLGNGDARTLEALRSAGVEQEARTWVERQTPRFETFVRGELARSLGQHFTRTPVHLLHTSIDIRPENPLRIDTVEVRSGEVRLDLLPVTDGSRRPLVLGALLSLACGLGLFYLLMRMRRPPAPLQRPR
jgi:hypothetical protein